MTPKSLAASAATSILFFASLAGAAPPGPAAQTHDAGPLIVTFVVLGLVFLVPIGLLVHGTVVKNKWGINFSNTPPAECPRCRTTVIVGRPGMWGGWSCVACQAAIDKWGRLEAGSAAPLTPEALDHVRAKAATDAAEVGVFLAQLQMRKVPVTWAVAAVSVATFGLQMLWGHGEPVAVASRMGANVPELVFHGEWWRMLASMVLHAGVLHLLLNMMAMLSFGPFLERLIGSARYALLYVLSGLSGSAFSLAHGSGSLGVGASGGIWGLMVAGAVVATWPRGLLPESLAVRLRGRAWLPVVINGVYSLRPNIDLLAHLGGGLMGALLVYILARPPAGLALPRAPAPVRAGAAVAGLALIASMGIAFAHGKPWALTDQWELASEPLAKTGLSLQIPTALRSTQTGKEGHWAWGDLNADGAEVHVIVPEERLTPEEAAESEFGLEFVRGMAEKSSKTMKISTAPAKVKLPSGRDAVFGELVPIDKDDSRFVWVWGLVVGGQPVAVIENVLATASDERKAKLRVIVDLIKEDAPKASPAARK